MATNSFGGFTFDGCATENGRIECVCRGWRLMFARLFMGSHRSFMSMAAPMRLLWRTTFLGKWFRLDQL